MLIALDALLLVQTWAFKAKTYLPAENARTPQDKIRSGYAFVHAVTSAYRTHRKQLCKAFGIKNRSRSIPLSGPRLGNAASSSSARGNTRPKCSFSQRAVRCSWLHQAIARLSGSYRAEQSLLPIHALKLCTLLMLFMPAKQSGLSMTRSRDGRISYHFILLEDEYLAQLGHSPSHSDDTSIAFDLLSP